MGKTQAARSKETSRGIVLFDTAIASPEDLRAVAHLLERAIAKIDHQTPSPDGVSTVLLESLPLLRERYARVKRAIEDALLRQ